MANDNTLFTVNKARDLQEEYERNKLFQELGDQIEGLKDAFIKQKNEKLDIEVIPDMSIINGFFKKTESMERTDVSMVDGVFVKKETPEIVKDGGILKKPFEVISEKLTDIYDVIKEQQEAFANFFLKESVQGPADKVKDAAKSDSYFMTSLKNALKTIVDIVATPAKSALSYLIPVFSFFTSFGGMVTAFGLAKFKSLPSLAKDFVTAIGAVTINLSKIVKGIPVNLLNGIPATIKLIAKRFLIIGGVLSLLNSALNINPNFEKTIKAFDKLVNGDAGNVLTNLSDLFKSIFNDVVNMFEPTDRLKRIISGIEGIIRNQIVPTFEFLQNEVFMPLYQTLETELFPRIVKALSFVDMVFSRISNFLLDVFGNYFETQLPVILNTLGSVLKYTFKVFKEVLKPLFSGLMTQFDITFGALASIITDIINIFNADSIEDVRTALYSIASTLVNTIKDTVDNIISTIARALQFDSFIGMKEGEMLFNDTIPRLITDMTNSITAFIDGFKNNVVAFINDGIAFVNEYNPIEAIKAKVRELVQFIIDLVPSIEDIKKSLLGGISSAGESVKDLFNELVFGETQTQAPADMAKNNTKRQQQINDLANFAKNLSPSVMYVDNKSQNITSSVTGGGNRNTGVAVTAPVGSRYDKHLYGIFTSQD